MIIEKKIPNFGFSTELNEAHKAFGQDLGIIAYVEGYEDVRFWGKEFKKLHLDVNVREISQFSVANGKDSILTAIKDGSITLGITVLICIDSDYDYLLSKNVDIYNSPFCFQTYAYAIENYYYNPIGLTELCYDAACLSQNSNDECLEVLFKHWSNYIYGSFLLYLLSTEREQKRIIQMSLKQLNLDTGEYNAPTTHTLSAIQLKSLTEKGLCKDNIFLYFRGHDIEKEVKRLAADLIKKLSRQKKEQLQKHKDANLTTEYFNKLKTIDVFAETRAQYPNNHCYKLLQKDIRQYSSLLF